MNDYWGLSFLQTSSVLGVCVSDVLAQMQTSSDILAQTGGVRDALAFFNPLVHQEKKEDDAEDFIADGSMPGLSELAQAAHHGQTATVERLLSSSADPNILDTWGQTPLFHAVSNGSLSIITSLMLARADPTRTSHGGLSPLDVVNDGQAAALMQALAPVASKLSPDIVDLDAALGALPAALHERFEEAMGADHNRKLAI